jgi:hypothetical protein
VAHRGEGGANFLALEHDPLQAGITQVALADAIAGQVLPAIGPALDQVTRFAPLRALHAFKRQRLVLQAAGPQSSASEESEAVADTDREQHWIDLDAAWLFTTSATQAGGKRRDFMARLWVGLGITCSPAR